MNIEQIMRAQREYFLSGATRPVERRMEALRRPQRTYCSWLKNTVRV